MIVVPDASALVELLLGTSAGRRAAARIADPGVALHVPHVADLEVAQVLRRYVLNGELSAARAATALTDLADLAPERHPHDLFLARIWSLRDNVSAYDGAYLVLAETLRATLLTGDRRLARAAERLVNVECVR